VADISARNIALLVVLLGLAALPGGAAGAETLVLRGGNVYASPEADPLPDAVVVITDGIINTVGHASDVQTPRDARVIDCTGKTIVAGFWNSHVHFTEAVWKGASSATTAPLTDHMRAMLTGWGFTSVWDLGSDPNTSLILRRRVQARELPGPNMFFAGDIFPENGHPAYLPAEERLPEAATPDQATLMAKNYLGLGLDGIKLFTGAYMGDKPVVNMDEAVAKAAVDIAHAQGRPVFAHPQNKRGLDTAIAAGVDVMAHIVPGEPGYTAEQLARFKQQGTALTPTLTLFATTSRDPALSARLVDHGVNQLRQFAENGGTVLFGTDVGFITHYDTALEYELMHRALSERQVLASLTTNPARYFKSARKGKVEQGFDADIVVLDDDPIADVRNLAKVAYTIRAGDVIYQKP
jgi:imidazolonepropionase-like amidohydrolase